MIFLLCIARVLFITGAAIHCQYFCCRVLTLRAKVCAEQVRLLDQRRNTVSISFADLGEFVTIILLGLKPRARGLGVHCQIDQERLRCEANFKTRMTIIREVRRVTFGVGQKRTRTKMVAPV